MMPSGLASAPSNRFELRSERSIRRAVARTWLIALLFVLPTRVLGAQTLQCRSATSNAAVALRRYVQNVVSGTRTSTTTFRSTLSIPAMDTSMVSLISSDSVCTRVTQVVDSVFARTSPSTQSLIVVQFGGFYGAYNPDVAWTGPSSMFILDTAFNYIRTITAF